MVEHRTYGINFKLLYKIVKHFYHGKRNIVLNLDNTIPFLGYYFLEEKENTHHIHISTSKCRNAEYKGKLTNLYDLECFVILTLLHELRHVMQAEQDLTILSNKDEDKLIKNSILRTHLSPSERDAESWALTHFEEGLKIYQENKNEFL